MSKTNASLGNQIRRHLTNLGLETPMVTNEFTTLSSDDKVVEISKSWTTIMEILGLDLTDDSLVETPHRFGKMLINDLMWGLDYSKFPKCTAVINKMAAPDEFVGVACAVNSICEHHILPIIPSGGISKPSIYIAYIPTNKVLGLSKMSRVAKFFGARPQVQERLTHQILEAIKFVTESNDVAVFASMAHLCMSIRGAEDASASTTTLAASGKFVTNSEIRREYLNIARAALSV